VLETHGEYNGRAEFTQDAKSKVVSVNSSEGDRSTVVTVVLIDGTTVSLAIAYGGDENTVHKVKHNDAVVEWVRRYAFLSSDAAKTKK
jgi:hypothetical protein